MKIFLKVLTSLFLLFNGIGAIYGGGSLILHPDGSGIQLSPAWLIHTLFHDYLIPGIILFIFNGLFSIFVFIGLLLNLKKQAWFIMAQGAILVGWILIQILLIRTIHFFHIILFFVGCALIVLGWIQKRAQYVR